MTVSPIPRRHSRTVEFHVGSTPAARADGGFEATLVMTPGGEPRVRLTQLAWGVGVGWYAQRTLDLDLAEAHQIAALLDRAPKCVDELPEIAQAVADLAPAAREPIDLAKVRARRSARRRRRSAGEADHPCVPPTQIARRHGSAATGEEGADR